MYKILILAACLCACSGLSAQRIQIDQVFGLGGTIADFAGTRTTQSGNTTLRSDYQFRIKQYGLVYGPRVDLLGTRDFSLSLAMPLFAGISHTNAFRSIDFDGVKRDTIDGLRGTHVAAEVPFFADLNFGLRSASDPSLRSFGFFAGIGYSYSYTSVKTTQGQIPFDRWEPVLRAGLRMGSSWEKRWSILFQLRGEFGSQAQKTYGLQILKDL